MRHIEFYMRVIEKAGASGAVLASGQAVTLKFPTGDRRSTQITPHEQLVDLIRDAAPPVALDSIDRNKQARFEVDSNGHRYAVDVQPTRGYWHVSIEVAAQAITPVEDEDDGGTYEPPPSRSRGVPEEVQYSESRRNRAPAPPDESSRNRGVLPEDAPWRNRQQPPQQVEDYDEDLPPPRPRTPQMTPPTAAPSRGHIATPPAGVPQPMPRGKSGAVSRGSEPIQRLTRPSESNLPIRDRNDGRDRRSDRMPAPRTNESVSGVMPPPPAPEDDAPMLIIERGQYEAPKGVQRTSGSALLDLLTANARSESASDVYLIAGHAPYMRVNGQLMATTVRSVIDPEQLSREIGVVAPTEVRQAWLERGIAGFTYSDGIGRVRVRLTRDHRGPSAAFRLLLGEPPTLADLGLYEIDNLLEDRGLILVGGPSGSGKTTTVAAMIRALGEDRRSVVVLDDVIEIVHQSPWISQRQIGMHVPDVLTGVEAAMAEGVDAIVIGSARDADRARAVIEAATGGHLVISTVVSPIAEVAADRLIDKLPEGARAGAREVVNQMLLGAVAPIIGHQGERTFEVVFGRRRA